MHTPLSSTHQFHTKEPLLSAPKSLSSTHLSILHQKPFSSTPLSSTPTTPQFNTLLQTNNRWGVSWTEGFLEWNWGVFGAELRGFWCWTEGSWCGTEEFWCWTEEFMVLNWGILGAEKVWSLCGTDVLTWGSLCGTEGYFIGFNFNFLASLGTSA